MKCKDCNEEMVEPDYKEADRLDSIPCWYCFNCNKNIPVKDSLILSNQLLEKQLIKYQRGFNIMMEYFDSIPDEEKEEVDKKLTECGL